MTAFLHLAPTGSFEDGVYIPFETVAEAERQAAWEWMHGGDPDAWQGVFEADYAVGPPRGWVYGGDPALRSSPHLDPGQRSRVHTKAQLAKAVKDVAPRLYEEYHRGQEDFHVAQARQVKRGLGDFKASIPGNAYTWNTGGTATATPAALTAATAKTVLLIVMASSNQASIAEIGVTFDGVTASNVPALVELISGTAGGAGTPRTTLAAGKQIRGWPAQTSQTTCGDTYSAEPTTELVNKKWFVTPNGGLLVIQNPLGREPTGVVTSATDAKTWGLRVTAPNAVNCHAYIEFEE